MSKTDFKTFIQDSGYKQQESEDIQDLVYEFVKSQLELKGHAKLDGLGTLKIKHTKSRKVVDNLHKREYSVASKVKVTFQCSEEFSRRLNGYK